jgi:chorismate mutase
VSTAQLSLLTLHATLFLEKRHHWKLSIVVLWISTKTSLFTLSERKLGQFGGIVLLVGRIILFFGHKKKTNFIDLKMRKPTDENTEWNIALAMQRAYIDELDTKLIDFLGKRMVVAEKIGQLKKEKNVAILQNKRWNAILDKMILDGSEKGLSEEFILKIFKAIHQESIAHQEKVFKK